jgi:hypothetical protein
MAKKLSLLMAAVAVIAFAVPAFASASSLTMPAGTLVPVGTKIVGTSTNTTTLTSLGLLSCNTVSVTGEVTANSGGSVAGIGIGTGNTSECFLSEEEAITITDITLESISSSTSGSGTIHFTFVADLPNNVVCHFVTKSAGASFNYVSGTDSLSIPAQKLEATPAACRPGEIEGTFTLETDPETGTGGVILD